MLSFYNDPSIKKKYVNRVLAHQKADNIIQGTGWTNGKGCAVGCTLENYNHYRYPIELGLPLWLAYLEDKIFEGLPNKDAKLWPAKFLKAIAAGIKETHFNKVLHKLAILRQQRNLKLQQKLYKKYKQDFYKEVIASIKLVIKYHKKPAAESAAWSAAWSAAELAKSAAESVAWSAKSAAWSAAELAAWSAAWSAAESAAWSAAESAAESAAWSAKSAAESAAESAAWSAAWSAKSAAESAAYKWEAKTLLKLLKELKPSKRLK